MGMLSRFKDIMTSNIHAWLNKAEDPLRTIDDYMRSLDTDLRNLQAETSSVIANERRAKRALDECLAEIDKLQRYAVKSVEAGNDMDARGFLERKKEQSEKLDSLQAAYDAVSANAEQMKQMQDKLMADRNELEARRTELKGKWVAAEAQQKINELESPSFRAMEEKVDRAYNEASALAELRLRAEDDLDKQFAQRERKALSDTEDEPAAIKEQLKKKE